MRSVTVGNESFYLDDCKGNLHEFNLDLCYITDNIMKQYLRHERLSALDIITVSSFTYTHLCSVSPFT